jgi:hypothetical protein
MSINHIAIDRMLKGRGEGLLERRECVVKVLEFLGSSGVKSLRKNGPSIGCVVTDFKAMGKIPHVRY